MDKQNTRTPMTLERFLYEHSPQAERYLREYQERHYPPSRTTPTPPAGQVEAVAEWPENIVADRHETTGKWVLHYLTDEQADKCKSALQASGAEHIAGLVGALEFYADRSNYLNDVEDYREPIEKVMDAPIEVFIIDEAGKDAGERARQALSALPPEMRGK